MAGSSQNKDGAGQARSLAKQIMLAFLNATLMLGIILAISGIILIHKVQNFTADTVEVAVHTIGEERMSKFNEQFNIVKEQSERIVKLSGDVESACRNQADLKPVEALREELSELRTDIDQMSKNFEDIARQAAMKALEKASRGVEDFIGSLETWFQSDESKPGIK